MKNKKIVNKILVLTAIAIVTGLAVSSSGYISELFKGQLNLHLSGEKMFTTGGSSDLPVFKICAQKGDCLTEGAKDVTIRFRLPNGEYINQISLEDGKFGNYQLVVDNNQSGSVMLAQRGTDKLIKLGSAQTTVSEDDAIYVKNATGLQIEMPKPLIGKGFDIFNLGFPINESQDINILTFEEKTADGTGEIFLAYPEFMEKRIDGKKMAREMLKIADDVNSKLAVQLETQKTDFYIIVTPGLLAPDFYRSTYYTASGMAYPKILKPDGKTADVKPKYGINLEKTFSACAAEREFKDKKCWEDSKSLSYVNYLLAHELTHLYQFSTGMDEKYTGDNEAFLEATAELSAIQLTTPQMGLKSKVAQRAATKTGCNKMQDNHATGFCMLANFANEIDSSTLKKLFKTDKSFNFGSNKKSQSYCETWSSIMEYATGKKTGLSKDVCSG